MATDDFDAEFELPDLSGLGTPVDATPGSSPPDASQGTPARRSAWHPTVESALENAAREHGVDRTLLDTFTRIESGGRHDARTGSYKGLFQLSDEEFTKHGGQGDPYDPNENARAGARKIRAETDAFTKQYGRQPTAAELYMIHQQGVGGAAAHWGNPDAPAWQNMFSTGEGQRKGPNWAKRAIWGNIPQDMKRQFGSVDNVTSRDFTDMWAKKVGDFGGPTAPTRMALGGPVAPKAEEESTEQETPLSLTDLMEEDEDSPFRLDPDDDDEDDNSAPMYLGGEPEGSGQKPDLSAFGTPVKGAPKKPAAGGPDLSSFGTKVGGEKKEVGDGFFENITNLQQYKEFVKGIVPGAVSLQGTALQAPDVVALRGQLGAAAFGAKQLEVMDRVDRGESVPETDDAFGYQHMAPADRAKAREDLIAAQAAFNPTPIQQRPLFKAGEAVQEYSKTIAPPAEGYEKSRGRQWGEGLGSMVGGLPYAALGTAPAGLFFGAAGIGEATQRAVEFDKKDREAGGPGLSQEQITLAGLMGIGPGATDLLPIEVLMGRLPIPVPQAMQRPLAQAVARIGGQAFVEGLQEGGQQFLQNLIAREVYNPDQSLSDEVLENTEAGGAVGAIAQGGKELGSAMLRRLAGGKSRGHATTPAAEPEQPQTAPPAPESQPDGAQPSAQREPAMPPPATADEAGLLRAQGWSETEIAEMDPAERAAAVEEARAQGLAPVAAPKAPDAPSAEPLKDLIAQAKDFADPKNPRNGLYLPGPSLDTLDEAGAQKISDALGAKRVVLPDFDGQGGALIVPSQEMADLVTQAKAHGADLQTILGTLTGAGSGKPANGNVVVQQRTKDGAVTRETLTTPGALARAKQDFAAPGRTVQTLSPQEAIARREQEIAALDSKQGTRAAPVRVETAQDVETASRQAAEPTEGQREVGNYQKGHLRLHDLDISIETPKGAMRRGKGWENQSPAAYGYIRGVPARSADKEHVDVYVGDEPQSQRAFIVNQVDPKTGRFDEAKIILGVRDAPAARAIYDAGFSDGSGPDRGRSIVETSVDNLRDLLESHDFTKPVPAQPLLSAEEVNVIADTYHFVNWVAEQDRPAFEDAAIAAEMVKNLRDEHGVRVEDFATEDDLRAHFAGPQASEETEGDTQNASDQSGEASGRARGTDSGRAERGPGDRSAAETASGGREGGVRRAEDADQQAAEPAGDADRTDEDRGPGGTRPDQRGVEGARETGPSDSRRLGKGLADLTAQPGGQARAVERMVSAETAAALEKGKEKARAFVLDRGKRTGTEYGAVVLPNGKIKHNKVVGTQAFLKVDATTAPDLYEGAPKSADFHHNHPKSTSFSRADYTEAAVRPAQRRTWVHGHDGSEYWASFNVDADAIGKGYDIARATTEAAFDRPGMQAFRYRGHLIAEMLRDAGLIEYGATLTPVDAQERVEALRDLIGEKRWNKTVEDIADLKETQNVHDRGAGSSGRRPDGVATPPQSSAATRPEPAGSEERGADRGAGAGAEKARVERETVAKLADKGGVEEETESDTFEGMSREGFAREQAIERSSAAHARRASVRESEALAREDRLGREAEKLTKAVAKLERKLLDEGVAPTEIVKRIKADTGATVSVDDIGKPEAWWRLAPRPGDRYSKVERDLAAQLYREGRSIDDIVAEIERRAGRKVSIRNFSYLLAQSGQQTNRNAKRTLLWPREANVVLARLYKEGAPPSQIVKALTRRFQQRYDAKIIDAQIRRLQLTGSGPQYRHRWQPEAVELLRELQNGNLSAAQIADRIQKETGQVVTRNSVIGMTHRLREERMRAELAEDLAKETGEQEEVEQDDYPRTNAAGFELKLAFKDKWGNPRFNATDRAHALGRLREIQTMPVKDVPWSDLVEARRDIQQITASLFYFDPKMSLEEVRKYDEPYYYVKDTQRTEKGEQMPSFFRDEGAPDDLKEFAVQGKQALDHLLDTRRAGVQKLMLWGSDGGLGYDKEPRRRGAASVAPGKVGEKMPSGFYFMAGRKIAEAPDFLFNMHGQAVINWLLKKGVSREEINHFGLQEKFGQKPTNDKPPKVSREEFQKAIAERMFDFRRKVSWLNPEISKNDYGETDAGKPIVRAFRGPRIPGRGVYFERLMAFPKKLKGGEEFAPGNFESPHWQDQLKGTWASWRGSVRDVPGWGRMVVGEEGQTDYMQGANARSGGRPAKRPRVSGQEYLGLKAQRAKYEKVMDEAYTLARDIADIAHKDYDMKAATRSDLAPAATQRELALDTWKEAIAGVREALAERSGELGEAWISETERKIAKLEALRTLNEEFFAPGANAKFAETESNFTPESPLDARYVRTMVRDLLLHAAKEKADSIAVSTTETNDRIQNNTFTSAGHFYDAQLKTRLERELRQLTGDFKLEMERVLLPKAQGHPRNEKAYSVWAAKLSPEVRAKIAAEGQSMFAVKTAVETAGVRPKEDFKSAIPDIRRAMGSMLKSGRAVSIKGEIVTAVHRATEAAYRMVPRGTNVYALTRVEPTGRGDQVVALFEDRDGNQQPLVMPWSQVSGARAFYFDGGIFFVRFNARSLRSPGEFDQHVAAELGHEVVHDLRRRGALAGPVWDALLAHAKSLRLLDGDARTYAKIVGDPSADLAADTTIRAIYEQYYSTRANPVELIDQEEVTHMMEWYLRGQLSPAEVAPVLDILEAIKDGDIAGPGTEANLEQGMAFATSRTAIEQRREFDRLGYYSQALEAAKGLRQAKGTPEQMRAQLRTAGAKEAELAATGLDVFLKDKSSVTRDEIVQFLRSNRVEVREVRSDAGNEVETTQTGDGAYDMRVQHGRHLATYKLNVERGWTGGKKFVLRRPDGSKVGSYPSISDAEFAADWDISKDDVWSSSNKWSQYSIDPSNPTYRETVIHLDPEVSPEYRRINAEIKSLEKRVLGEEVAPGETVDDRLGKLYSRLGEIKNNSFMGGHWSEPNVIAHARTSIQKDSSGKPVFLIDELQSDWGQKLRDGGVRDEAKVAALRERVADLRAKADAAKAAIADEIAYQVVDHPSGTGYAIKVSDGTFHLDHKDAVRRFPNAAEAQAQADVWNRLPASEKAVSHDTEYRRARDAWSLADAELRTAEAATPGHPLVNTTDQWTTTAFRRLIRQAVEAGAESIALTPGKVQNERFNLAKQVEALRYNVAERHLSAVKVGSRIDRRNPVSSNTTEWTRVAGDIGPEELPAHIGKEMSEKLLAAPKHGNSHVLLDLGSVEIGGSGMKATYDSIYPRTLGKLLSKMDGSVKMEDKPLVSSLDDHTFAHDKDEPLPSTIIGMLRKPKAVPDTILFHTFPLTEKVKRAVMEEGQPLFAIAGVKAKGAPLSSRNLAESMERKGRKPEQILKDTGWFRGADGLWRFEIDDSAAKIVNLNAQLAAPARSLFRSMFGMRSAKQPKWAKGSVRTGVNVKLPDILQHDKLYAAYPFLRQMRANLIVGKGVPKAREGGALVFRKKDGGISYMPIIVRAQSESDVLPTLMHEIQHYIQLKEGFATGSSPSTKNPRDVTHDKRGEPHNLDFSLKTGRVTYPGLTFSPDTAANKATENPRDVIPYSKAEEKAIYLAYLHDLHDRGEVAHYGTRAGLERSIAYAQAELVELLSVRPGDYVNSAGEREANLVMQRLRLSDEERRAAVPSVGSDTLQSRYVGADLAEAANETLRRARFSERLRQERLKKIELAPGIQGHWWFPAGSWTFNTLADFTRNQEGRTLTTSVDFATGYAVIQIGDVGRSDMGENWEEESGVGVRKTPMSLDRLNEVVDATEKYLRAHNLTPTGDLRLLPSYRQHAGRNPEDFELKASEIAFWRQRNPAFMLDVAGGFALFSGDKLLVDGAPYEPASAAEHTAINALHRTNGDWVAALQNLESDRIRDMRNYERYKAAQEFLRDIRSRADSTQEIVEMPMPADLAMAGLDPEIWNARTREAHQAEEAGVPMEEVEKWAVNAAQKSGRLFAEMLVPRLQSVMEAKYRAQGPLSQIPFLGEVAQETASDIVEQLQSHGSLASLADHRGHGIENYSVIQSVLVEAFKDANASWAGAPSSRALKAAFRGASAIPHIDATAQSDLASAIEDAVNIVNRIAGPGVSVRFQDTIAAEGTVSEEQRAATEAAGFRQETVGGFYQRPTLNAGAIIGLATNDPSFDLRTTAGHEAWHHVEEVLATPAEKKLLSSPSEMQRMRSRVAQEIGLEPGDPRLDAISAAEIRAIAFQRYRREREEGMQPAGFHIGVRRFWDRVLRILAAVKNALSLKGFKTYEDVFEKARTGEMVDRRTRTTVVDKIKGRYLDRTFPQEEGIVGEGEMEWSADGNTLRLGGSATTFGIIQRKGPHDFVAKAISDNEPQGFFEKASAQKYLETAYRAWTGRAHLGALGFDDRTPGYAPEVDAGLERGLSPDGLLANDNSRMESGRERFGVVEGGLSDPDPLASAIGGDKARGPRLSFRPADVETLVTAWRDLQEALSGAALTGAEAQPDAATRGPILSRAAATEKVAAEALKNKKPGSDEIPTSVNVPASDANAGFSWRKLRYYSEKGPLLGAAAEIAARVRDGSLESTIQNVPIASLRTPQANVSASQVAYKINRSDLSHEPRLPIVVRHRDGSYSIHDGNHRVQARAYRGFSHIRAHVLDEQSILGFKNFLPPDLGNVHTHEVPAHLVDPVAKGGLTDSAEPDGLPTLRYDANAHRFTLLDGGKSFMAEKALGKRLIRAHVVYDRPWHHRLFGIPDTEVRGLAHVLAQELEKHGIDLTTATDEAALRAQLGGASEGQYRQGAGNQARGSKGVDIASTLSPKAADRNLIARLLDGAEADVGQPLGDDGWLSPAMLARMAPGLVAGHQVAGDEAAGVRGSQTAVALRGAVREATDQTERWAEGDANVMRALAKVGATQISVADILPEAPLQGQSLLITRDGSIFRLRIDTSAAGGHYGFYKALEGEPSPVTRVVLFTGREKPSVSASTMWGMLRKQADVFRAIARNYGVPPKDLVLRKNSDSVADLGLAIPQAAQPNVSISNDDNKFNPSVPFTPGNLNGFVLDPQRSSPVLAALGGRDGATGGAATHGLDMSPAARKARAEAMGFDTSTVWYHGTPTAGFEAFDVSRERGQAANNGFKGVSLTTRAQEAGAYAVPRIAEAAAVYPVYARVRNPFVVDLAHKFFPEELSDRYAYTEGLERQGYDALQIVENGSVRELVVFDPANIRSVNAAFDPAQEGSPVLMASLIPAVMQKRAAKTLARVGLTSANWDAFRVGIQDKVLPIRRVQEAKEAQTGTQIPINLDTYIAEALYHGRAGERLTDLQDKYIEPLIEGLRKADIDLEKLGDYLYARHAQERNAAIAKIDPTNAAGSGMTDAEATRILTAARANAKTQAAYDAAAKIVDDMLEDSRKTLLKAGLIDRETYDNWSSQYAHYVPLRGWESGNEDLPDRARTGRGFDVRGPEAKQALGRRSKADNPVAYALLQAQQAIVRAEKNRVDKTLYRFIQAYPDPDLYQVYKGETRRRINPGTGLVEDHFVNPAFVNNDRVHGVKIGGKQYYMELKDPALARAMRGTQGEAPGAILRGAMRLARLYSSLLTSYNPEFVVSNFFRDMETALINVTDVKDKPEKVRRQIVKDALSLKSIRGVFNALRGDGNAEFAKWFEEYRQAGGKISFMENNDVEKIQNDITKSLKHGRFRRVTSKAFEFIDDLNAAVENGVRLSTYAAMRKAGINQDRAAFVARELTVNFNRKGEWSSGINALYLFFNASTQGTARLAQAVAKSKAVRYTVASIFGVGLALDLLNYMVAGDDDDGKNAYDKIPEWIKERNLIIMIPGSKKHDYVQIPLAYGYNVPFLAGQQVSSVMRGATTPTKAVVTIGKNAFDVFNPLGSAASLGQFVAPTMLDPFMQVIENKNWYGGKIFPTKRDKNLPDSENYFSSANPWFVDAAKYLNRLTGGNSARAGTLDISPEVIEHFFEFATGGVGKFIGNAVASGQRVVNGEEWLPEKTPFLRRVYGKATTASRRRDFFEAWDKVDAAKYEVDNLIKGLRNGKSGRDEVQEARDKYAVELKAWGQMQAVQKQLSGTRKQRDVIQLDRSLSDVEKRQRIEVVEARENGAILRALGQYNRAKKEAGRKTAD